jgi:membrane protein
VFDIVKETLRTYGERKAPLLAAALAYYSVFSLAPLLLVLTSVLIFVGAGDAQTTVIDVVSERFGESVAELIHDMIQSQAERGGGIWATIIGTIALLVGATTLFAQLERALNIIWDTEPDPDSALGSAKHLAMQRVRSLGLILLIGVLLLLAIFLSTYVSAAIGAATEQLPGGGVIWVWLNRLFALAVLAVVFGIVFTLLPNASVPKRAVLIGAPVTAVLFVLASWAFGIYMTNVAIESAYGAAGSLVALLLWVFISAHAVLLGAVFTKVVAQREDEEHGVRRPSEA